MTSYIQTRSLTQKATLTDSPIECGIRRVAEDNHAKPSNTIQTPKYTYDLRSSTPKEHEVHLDFDESTRAWNSNKRSIGNGCYTYLVNEPVVERPKRMRRSPVRYQV
uniref:Uncharacterized protein n=1 Tax=viral metagenome TaxID=1070528 RepID=A0A6C0HUQ1_9ZZZZ